MNQSPPRSDSSPNDDRLYELVEEFSQRISRGDPITADEFATMYAEYSEDLRSILPALTVLCDLSELPNSSLPTETHGVASVPQSLGDFRIIRQIGQGGMGYVYEAEQMSLGRRVAVKVLPFAGMLNGNQLQRFKHEAHAAASLHHRHIVNAFFFGQERGVHFYAMQLIEGQSLAEIIQALYDREDAEAPDTLAETQPVTALSTSRSRDRHEFYRAVARIGIEAADALTYAHSLGVVHRDIKPSNILIDRDHHTWVTDFGLASTRTESNLTLTGDVLGTLRYMSPEQASGNAHLDHRTDVYSLGVTLYELTTGRPVLDGSNQAELIRQLEDSDPPSPRSLDSKIPRDLERILFKTIAKSPSDRYDSAQELSEDLRRFLDNKPVRARRLTRRQRLWRWSQRNRALALTLTTVALLLLLLGTIGPMLAVSAIASSRAAIRTNHSSSTLNAYEAWHQGRIDRIPDMLWTNNDDPYVVSLRGWEWEHLWNRYLALDDVSKYRFNGHRSTIALSPDGQRIAAYGLAQGTGLLQVCDANSLALLASRETPHIVLGQFSPDNRTFLGFCSDGKLRGWETERINEIFQLEFGQSRIGGMQVSPRGDLLALSRKAEDRVDLWSLEQILAGNARSPVRSLSHTKAQALAFSRDGGKLASCNELGLVHIWSVDDGKQRVAPFRIDGSTPINTVAFHPTRDILATDGSGIRLWDASTGQLLARWGAAADRVMSLAFSNDGKKLVAGGGKRVELWDVDRHVLIDRLRSKTGPCWQVLFSPNGKSVIASCGPDRVIHKFKVPPVPRVHTSATFVEFVGHAQQYLAVASRAYRLEEGEGSFRLWDVAKKSDAYLGGAGKYGAVACSPANKNVVAILRGTTITLRDVADQADQMTLRGHQTNIDTAAFSPDGELLASVARRKNESVPELMLWDLTARQPTAMSLLLPDEFSPYRAAFSPGGRILLVAGGWWTGSAGIYLYDVRTKSLINALHSDAQAPVFLGLCFSPDGKLVAAGGYGRRILCFDWAKRKLAVEIKTEGGAAERVLALTFSPDRRRLVAGFANGRVGIWDSSTGDQVALLDAGSTVYDVKFSEDGNILAAGCGNGAAVLWHADGRKETIAPK